MKKEHLGLANKQKENRKWYCARKSLLKVAESHLIKTKFQSSPDNLTLDKANTLLIGISSLQMISKLRVDSVAWKLPKTNSPQLKMKIVFQVWLSKEMLNHLWVSWKNTNRGRMGEHVPPFNLLTLSIRTINDKIRRFNFQSYLKIYTQEVLHSHQLVTIRHQIRQETNLWLQTLLLI